MSDNMQNKFTKEIFSKERYYAPWYPDKTVQIGDYGTLEGKCFKYLGNLKKEFDIKLETKRAQQASDWVFMSEGVSVMQSKSDVELSEVVPATIDASLGIRFKNELSTYLSSKGNKYIEIQSYSSLESDLKHLYDRKRWKLKYVVVTEIMQSSQTSILISNARDQTFEIQGEIGVNEELLKLVDFGTHAKCHKSSEMGFECLGKMKLTPRFSLAKLNRTLVTRRTSISRGPYWFPDFGPDGLPALREPENGYQKVEYRIKKMNEG